MLFETFIVHITILTLCFLTIAGLSIWTLEDDIYMYLYPHSYEFLWFLVIVNMIISITIIGLVINKKTRIYIEKQLSQLGSLIYIILTPITLVISVCWMSIASNITQITTECFNFKKTMEKEYLLYKFTCTGEIMISIFGFVLFIIYGSLFLFNAKNLIKMLIDNYKYNKETENEILETSHEFSEITTRQSSLTRNTNVV